MMSTTPNNNNDDEKSTNTSSSDEMTAGELLRRYNPRLMRNLEYPCWNPGDLTSMEIEDRAADGSMNEFIDEVSWQPHYGLTPICRAMKQNNMDLVNEVLAVPSTDINARNEDNNTPLAMAAEHRPKFLERLMQHPGIDVNLKDAYGFPPIVACMLYSEDYLESFITLAKPLGLDINATNDQGTTPLLMAITKAPNAVPILLCEGADPNLTERNDISPIMMAGQDNPDLLLPLFEAGGRLTTNDLYALARFPQSFNKLIEASPTYFDWNTRIPEKPITFLMLLCQNYPDKLKECLDHDPALDVTEVCDENHGTNAVFQAAIFQPQALMWFLERGVDINNCKTKGGSCSGTPLLHFIVQHVPQHAWYVIAAGADANALDSEEHTALQVAKMKHPDNEALIKLLENGDVKQYHATVTEQKRKT